MHHESPAVPSPANGSAATPSVPLSWADWLALPDT